LLQNGIFALCLSSANCQKSRWTVRNYSSERGLAHEGLKFQSVETFYIH